MKVEADIRSARTLPAAVYRDEAVFARWVRELFPRTWHLLGDGSAPTAPGDARPVTLLPGCVDEPLLFTRDRANTLHLLSNACTHRGALVVASACNLPNLRCRYHGRRFGLDGRFAHHAEFEGAIDFPSASDDLPRVPLGTLGPLHFASLAPSVAFDALLEGARDRIAPLLAHLPALPTSFRDYDVAAHWALYCDNYLEGFHIPFVHASLAEVLDYGAYTTELLPHGTLQVGIAKPGEPTFTLPAGHPDHGRAIAAYYLWLFPGTMVNLYPWGLSVNAVRPVSSRRTIVSFIEWVTDPSLRAQGAGGDLHRVEMEDEEVVESVQRGVRSHLYREGRFSPSRETGVHHFHRMLAATL